MKYLSIVLVLAGLILVSPIKGQAQLVQIKQTVYGMDCAPCAYALENRTKAMKGIESVSVSLNNGLLTATFSETHSITLKSIREAIQASGFSARDAEIEVSGTLQQENGHFVLITPAGEKFILESDKETIDVRLKDIEPGQSITLAGTILQEEFSETKPWSLHVDNGT